jgi:hypothetical protein
MTDLHHDRLSDFSFKEPPAPRAEISRAIRDACTHELAPAVGLTVSQRVLATGGIFLGVVAILAALSSAHERLDQAPVRAALLGVIGWGVVMLGVLLVGLVRPPGRRWARAARISLAVSLPLVFFGYLLATTEHRPLADFMQSGTTHALQCGFGAALAGSVASLGILWVWRGTDPLSPRVSGALAGLIGGTASAVAIGVSCPSHEVWHLSLSHGTMVVGFALVGALAGRRWLAP